MSGSIPLSSTGEIIDVMQSDQFQWRAGQPLTQFGCGYWMAAIMRSMARVGRPPTLTPAQEIADALAWYREYNGSDAGTNTAGMTLQQEYDLLHEVGLHYQETALDVHVIRGWLRIGYPVAVAVAETVIRDLELGDRNPFPWRPAGNHIISLTGIAKDGVNVLVRDSANCTNLYDPTSLRPGPRTYDAVALQDGLVSATVIVPPWYPRPTSSIPPLVPPALPPVGPLPAPSHPNPPTTKWASVAQEQAARNEWNSTAHLFGGTPPPYDTGIALAWQANYRAEVFDGPPLTGEYGSVDWHGIPIRVQQFARKRYEWYVSGVLKRY